MKKAFSAIFSACLLAACSSPKPAAPVAPMSEYDMASGTWQPTSRVVVPNPPQPEPAPVPGTTPPPKEGMLSKIGTTLKKPLTWLPWHKDAPAPAPTEVH